VTNSRTNCTVIIMHLKLLPEQHVHEFIEKSSNRNASHSSQYLLHLEQRDNNQYQDHILWFLLTLGIKPMQKIYH